MQKDIKDIKEFKQPKPNKISFLKSTPQVIFDMILSFSGPSIGMLLASKSAYAWSQAHWEKRIFFTIDPSLPDLLTPFTIYRHYQILFKTNEYRTGMRLAHPLLPAYIQSRCSENDLQKYSPQDLLKKAAEVGNGLMIQWLTAPQRGHDRVIPDILDVTLSLPANKELLKLIISAAEEQKRPFRIGELFYISDSSDYFRIGMKSLVELWVDESWADEEMRYGKEMLHIAAYAGNLDWVKKIIDKGVNPVRKTLELAIQSGNLNLVLYLIKNFKLLNVLKPAILKYELAALLSFAASYGRLDIFKWLALEYGWLLVSEKEREEILKSAVKSNNSDLLSWILSLEVNHYRKLLPGLLLEAATQGNVQMMKLIMSDELKPNREVLNRAARTGNLQAVELIMSSGIDPDQETLNQAIKSGRLNLVKRILETVRPDINTLKIAIEEGVQLIIEDIMTRVDFDELDLLEQINKASDGISYGVTAFIAEWLISQLSKGRFETNKNRDLLESNAIKLFYINAKFKVVPVVKLMLEEKTRNYLSFRPTQETLNSLASIGDESLVESLLVSPPNLQPTMETIQLAMQSGNRLLIKMLIESVMRNTDDDLLIVAKAIFQTAVNENHLWSVQWLMAKDRGENRLMPIKSMIHYAKSIGHEDNFSKIILWLKEQLSYHLLFSFKLFSEVLSFLPAVDQSKLAIISKEGKAFTKGYWQGQSALTIFNPSTTHCSNSLSLKEKEDFKPHR